MPGARDEVAIHLDRDLFRFYLDAPQEFGNGQGAGHLAGLSVQRNGHGSCGLEVHHGVYAIG